MLPTIKDAVTAASEARHATAQILDKTGTQSAEALRAAASSIEGLADRTQSGFNSASQIVESYDAATMVNDIRRIVRRHPGSFLLAAAAVAATLGYAAGSSKNSLRRT